MQTVVAILSGGLDSTVMLADLIAADHCEVVEAISFDYGQRHATMELASAVRVALALNVTHKIIQLPLRDALSSALTGHGDIPEGHYEHESMKATVVPNRNMILLAVAAGRAMSLKANAVAYGAHAGDHAVYADCRPSFVNLVRQAVSQASYEPIDVMAPYLRLRKEDIVARARDLGVLDLVAKTYSCYTGRDAHCGKCGTCTERREAFALAGVDDPTVYA